MNYANLVEDKNLKKGFVIATLISTVVGTFTASLALHDKIKEKRDKSRQKATDKDQDDELRDLREQVKQLQSRGRGRERRTDTKEKNSRYSRSRSSSTQSYRSGRWHRRRGDSLERALDKEADIIRVQQEVNNVLQDALAKRPNMSQADLNKLVTAAKMAAREGSVDKLRGHYDRLLATTSDDVANVANEQAAPTKGVPAPDQLRPRVTDNVMPPPSRPASRAPSRVPSRAGSRHDSAQDDDRSQRVKSETGKARTEGGRPPTEPGKAVPVPDPDPVPSNEARFAERQAPQRARSVHGDPFAQYPGPENPQKIAAHSVSPKSNLGKSSRAPHPDDEHRLPMSRASLLDEKDRSKSVCEDPSKQATPSQRSKSVYQDPLPNPPKAKSEVHPSTGAYPARSAAPERARQGSENENQPPSKSGDAKTQVYPSDWRPPVKEEPPKPKSIKAPTVTQLPSKPRTEAGRSEVKSASVKPEPPKSRITGVVPIPKDPVPPSKPVLESRENAKEKQRSAMKPASVQPEPPKSRITGVVPIPKDPVPPSKTVWESRDRAKEKQRSANNSPRSGSKSSKDKRPLKALPPPPNDLFCRYAQDLQTSQLPLHPNFKHAGSHRCPHCLVKIPVDTRDVWVLSTHFPKSRSSSSSDPPKTRDYRMDARFVAKCHTTGGEYACVLCDKYRDLDCICRSVDALVKHLGTAHTPEEFEGEGDLVRMRRTWEGEGTVRGRNGEMALT